MAVFDLGRLLLILSEEQVEFIIVGGVAAADGTVAPPITPKRPPYMGGPEGRPTSRLEQ
jgi:hypothetical protein